MLCPNFHWLHRMFRQSGLHWPHQESARTSPSPRSHNVVDLKDVQGVFCSSLRLTHGESSESQRSWIHLRRYTEATFSTVCTVLLNHIGVSPQTDLRQFTESGSLASSDQCSLCFSHHTQGLLFSFRVSHAVTICRSADATLSSGPDLCSVHGEKSLP